MNTTWNWLRGVADPLWQRFLRLYDGHRVVTLSVMNAVSLFLFALIALTSWVGHSGEAHASAAPSASESPVPSQLEVAEPEAAQAPDPDPEYSPPPAPPAVEPRLPGRVVKKLAGRREYPVQVRRQLRVYTEDQWQESPQQSAEDAMERSDDARFDP